MAEQPTSTPIIVQSDGSILLDVHDTGAESARSEIAPFCELEKSPEHIHTYKITPLSLWNAASAGLNAETIQATISKWSRFPVPENILYTIEDIIGRFGKLRLLPLEDDPRLYLYIEDPLIKQELASREKLKKYLYPWEDGFLINLVDRGTIKVELIRLGFPVKDEVPLSEGAPIAIELKEHLATGESFTVRDYQREAAEAFYGEGKVGNGFGTIVLPCGAGKTVVGITAMDILKTSTLILTTNVAAVHQWIDELVDKTSLKREEIGEYTGDNKNVQNVTIATYQILTWRKNKESNFPHFSIFLEKDWGLIIYDEVHLLPAPVFRITAEIQAVRRLGLTATLVREDGREEEVFSLVGPKRYDVPWKELEAKGWIAQAYCHELRLNLAPDLKIPYATAGKREKFKIASTNPKKLDIARQLIENHPDDSIMIIGHYLDQLGEFAKQLKAPIITGKTPNKEREAIYGSFRKGEIQVIVVSKVANFAIDLPDASVAIQISGTFGSRQEEAQRLGRILRPKKKNSYFYTLVTRYTEEEQYAANRQKFLTEQGYKYHIELWD